MRVRMLMPVIVLMLMIMVIVVVVFATAHGVVLLDSGLIQKRNESINYQQLITPCIFKTL